MRSTNSYAGYILGLYEALFKDCASQYPALAKEFERDLTRLRSAIECHGIRFVLETMPAWRKHLDVCLAEQRLSLTSLHHFGAGGSGRVIPRFLRGLTLRVFDREGFLRPDPDVQAIRWLRQLLGVARKLRVDCGPKAVSTAVRDFVRTDLELRLPSLDWSGNTELSNDDVLEISFSEIARADSADRQKSFDFGDEVPALSRRHLECIQFVADYITGCLGFFDPSEWRFKHGPGAVADQRFEVDKYDFDHWPDRLARVFPAEEFATANYSAWELSKLHDGDRPGTQSECPAKLLAVPKTIVTPRLIAAEPTSLQWCQQAIRDCLYDRVHNSPLRSFVDFRRQDLNGELAREASHTGSHCTIDLSSASDRVSCWHVERLFRRSPSLLSACVASRSAYIRQDICRYSPRHVLLRKYSTMGNATTFPVQSLFFLAIILGTVLYERNLRWSSRAIRTVAGDRVRVFGDDLIVPEDCAGSTIGALRALGLRVNAAKTFVAGRFRESCGVDAYDGHNVTTVSVLDVPIQAGPGSIASCVDVHNNLLMGGYVMASSYLRKTVDMAGYSRIRTVPHGSGLFGWYPNYVDNGATLKTRWNRDLHRREVRCLSLVTKVTAKPVKDGAALLRFFTERPEVVERSKSTLYHQARRARASLALRWAAVA